MNNSAKDKNYVSRAALKLESVANALNLDFKGMTVLDVGSSSGGFTDYALSHGAAKVIAVEKGTDQMDPRLRLHPKLELHEKTDIRDFVTDFKIDLVLIDVSFVSLKVILPKIKSLINSSSVIVAMAKPQFETSDPKLKNKGVIKNERIRRQLLSELEAWLRPNFIIEAKADSKISGVKGNLERFYRLRITKAA